MENNKVGKKIFKLRIAANLTQVRLGDMTGIEPTAISHIECGRRNPNCNTVKKIAKALGITIDEMLND